VRNAILDEVTDSPVKERSIGRERQSALSPNAQPHSFLGGRRIVELAYQSEFPMSKFSRWICMAGCSEAQAANCNASANPDGCNQSSDEHHPKLTAASREQVLLKGQLDRYLKRIGG
jgi:hypothetical protein